MHVPRDAVASCTLPVSYLGGVWTGRVPLLLRGLSILPLIGIHREGNWAVYPWRQLEQIGEQIRSTGRRLGSKTPDYDDTLRSLLQN